MASGSDLCQFCQLLFFDGSRAILDDDGRRSHPIPLQYEFENEFPFLPLLTSSARAGCHMCGFIKQLIWSHFKSDPALAEHFRREARKLKDRPDEARKKIHLVLSEYYPVPSEMFTEPYPDFISGQVRLDGIASSIKIRVEQDSVASPSSRHFPGVLPLTKKSVRMMQGWMSRCVDSESDQHSSCSKAKESIAPLRLLDVMYDDRVRIAKSEGLILRYAILSYCWGESATVEAARTVQSNISERMATFSLSGLPQTLIDSVVVARSLKIQYIWIDSLCIVQDSDEWPAEAGRMMDYYANSCITIVPIACKSADEGFLEPRPHCVSVRLTGTWIGQPHKLLQFYYPPQESGMLATMWSSWSARGWTMQERLLSEWILYFGRFGTWWDCRGATYEELKHRESRQENQKTFLGSSSHLTREWDTLESARYKWYQIVSEYVERHLRHESDKLIALSGVARKFGILFDNKDEYISGFWENDLCHGLCWRFWAGTKRLIGEEGTWKTTKSPFFPSWSWCSMGRPIMWPDGTGSIQCAELCGKVKSSGDNKCGGKGEYAKLLLRSWVFSARLLNCKFPGTTEIFICLDAENNVTETLDATKNYMAVVMSAYLDDDGDEDEWRASPTKAPHEVYGLVVENAGTRHLDIEEYRRIGTFDVQDSMGSGIIQDSVSVTKPFHEQVYASPRTIALI